MRLLSILFALVLIALTVLDLRITFRTGVVQGSWGNVASEADLPETFWRHVYTSCIVVMLWGGFVLWELGRP
jgi:hypothetical protein